MSKVEVLLYKLHEIVCIVTSLELNQRNVKRMIQMKLDLKTFFVNVCS